jgi:hypothetical protein
MKIKLLVIALLTVILASCGGSTPSAAKKQAATKAFTTYSALFSNPAVGGLGPKARQVTPRTTTACSGGGSITVTVTSSTITFSTPATGCIENGTTLIATNFVLSITGTASETDFDITMTMNGSITVTSGGTTNSASFGNLSIRVTGTTSGQNATITINGSITSDGQTTTFNNDTFTSADLS